VVFAIVSALLGGNPSVIEVPGVLGAACGPMVVAKCQPPFASGRALVEACTVGSLTSSSMASRHAHGGAVVETAKLVGADPATYLREAALAHARGEVLLPL
jgi:hypothetical protein